MNNPHDLTSFNAYQELTLISGVKIPPSINRIILSYMLLPEIEEEVLHVPTLIDFIIQLDGDMREAIDENGTDNLLEDYQKYQDNETLSNLMKLNSTIQSILNTVVDGQSVRMLYACYDFSRLIYQATYLLQGDSKSNTLCLKMKSWKDLTDEEQVMHYKEYYNELHEFMSTLHCVPVKVDSQQEHIISLNLALHTAVGAGYFQLLCACLQHGADPNSDAGTGKNFVDFHGGLTVLMEAAATDGKSVHQSANINVTMMAKLIQSGADINKISQSHNALMAAVFWVKVSSVKFLLKKGANINQVVRRDDREVTALSLTETTDDATAVERAEIKRILNEVLDEQLIVNPSPQQDNVSSSSSSGSRKMKNK